MLNDDVKSAASQLNTCLIIPMDGPTSYLKHPNSNTCLQHVTETGTWLLYVTGIT